MPNLTWFSPKVEKRASRIEGRGLFANEAIAKDEIVVVKGGYILAKDQRDRIGKDLDPSEIQVVEDLFIGPTTLAEREGGAETLADRIIAGAVSSCRPEYHKAVCEIPRAPGEALSAISPRHGPRVALPRACAGRRHRPSGARSASGSRSSG
jgi:hypothetical protein